MAYLPLISADTAVDLPNRERVQAISGGATHCTRPANSTCAQYHRARRRGHRDSWCYWQVEPGTWLDQWRELCADEELAAQLACLPADAYKVEASAQMVAVYWGERAQADALQRIADFLLARA